MPNTTKRYVLRYNTVAWFQSMEWDFECIWKIIQCWRCIYGYEVCFYTVDVITLRISLPSILFRLSVLIWYCSCATFTLWETYFWPFAQIHRPEKKLFAREYNWMYMCWIYCFIFCMAFVLDVLQLCGECDALMCTRAVFALVVLFEIYFYVKNFEFLFAKF